MLLTNSTKFKKIKQIIVQLLSLNSYPVLRFGEILC